MNEPKMNARMCAYKILYKIECDGAFSNIALKDGLRDTVYVGADRRLVTTIVYGCVKYKRYLDYVISRFSSVKLKKLSENVLILLRIGAYQILMLERVPDSAAVNECVKLASKLCYKSKAFVNAVLRKISSNKDEISLPDDEKERLGVKYSYPDDIVSLWTDEFGIEFAQKLLEAGNENPPLSVRVNTLRTTKDKLAALFEKEGIETEECAEGMLVLKGSGDIGALESYKNGLFTPQGTGSYFACRALNPQRGQTVMDLCAAPGGKSTHIAEMMENEGAVYSFDIHAHKTELIDAAAKRLGINIIKTAVRDSSVFDEGFDGKADCVLCDVPCSGLGIIHKKPDIKWGFDLQGQRELVQIQTKILETGSGYVKKGGILVYSTCTVSHSENLDIVKKFLDTHGDFELCGFDEVLPDKYKKESAKEGYVQFYPTDDGMDGFFICKMKRKG